MGFIGSNDIIVGLVLLEHEPHGLDVFFGEAPVPFGVEITEEQFILEAFFDLGQGTSYFTGDKGLTSPWRFMIKENPVAGMQAVGFAVIHCDPKGKVLGAAIGAAR